jgi:cyclopropane-fatty-acyl-phospholipid synthase
MRSLIRIAESGVVPDPILRLGIRHLLRERLRKLERIHARREPADLAARFDREPVAVETDRANEQHYELPASFFRLMLGPRLKYSACVWPDPECSLEQAEAEALRLTCERAELRDGMRLLDLGCGWGSLSLYPRKRTRGRQRSEASTLTADVNGSAPQPA